MNASGSYQDLFNTDSSSDLFASLLPNSVVVTDRDTLLQSEPLPDGKILTGTVSGVRGKTLSGTARQVIVTNDADEIKLTLPQDIDTVSKPRFSGVRVSDDVDFVFDPSDFNGWQEVRQTIVAAEPYAVDRTWSLPLISDVTFDPASNLTFAALEGRQTFTGPKSFWETMQVNDIVPVSNGSYNLGATDRRFRYLYLGRGSGTIDLGIDNGGRAELKLISNGSAAQIVTFGESGSPIAESGWNWRLSGRDSGEGRNFNLYRGPYLTASDPEIIMQCRSDTGDVVFPKNTDSTDTKTGAVRFSGGIGVAKSVHATHVVTESLTVGGVPIVPIDTSNLVTTNTAQTVTGKKLFTQDVNIGTDKFGRLRFSTYGGGDSFINGGYTDDSDYFLEFYCRGVKAFEIRNGYPGSGRDREVTVPGSLTTGHVYPTVNDTRNIGSASRRFGRLFLGNVQGSDTGTITLGHGIRTARRAELHLHSAGDQPAEIMFGVNARTDANVKWSLGSRESGTGDAFRLYRGTMLTGGAFVNVLDIIGSGTDAGQFKLYTATDSASTTTGSATFAGGVGIAKTLNAARVIVPRGTGAIDARFTGAQPELFINSDGDGISQLSFGSGPAESANVKWAISSRASGTNNEGLRVYRGPKLAGGSWDQIIQIDGTGADAGRVIFNKGDPSTSTTTGAVQIRGGLGVAGAIYAGSINVAAPDKRLLVSNAGAVGWSNSTFADTTSSTVLGTGAGYQPAVPDPTGFDTYMANSNTVYGASAGYTTVKTVSRNTYIGERAGVGIGSHTNTAVGYRAFDTGTAPWNNLCHNNTAIGAYVMHTTATSGVFMSNNTAVGSHAMNDFASGSANVAIGGASGAGFTTGNYCTFIGHAAGGTGGNRRIAIGADAKVTEDNHCRIGDSNITGLTLGSTNADIGKSNHRVRTIYTTNLDISGAITMPYYNGGFYLTNGLGTFNLYCPVHIVKLGRLTTVQISWASWFTVPSGPAWTLSGNTIPDGYRPFSFNSLTLPITNGGVEQAARFNVYADGKVEIIPMPAGHFAVGQAGLSVFSFSFIAAA